MSRASKMNSKNRGFTLIEMLVVIGIIAILSGALLMGFGRVTKAAQRAKAVEAVSQAAQALVILRQKNDGVWPQILTTAGGGDGSGRGMIVDVAKKFAEYDMLGIAKKNGMPVGISRCGVVDPWAEAVLKRNQNANVGSRVPTGGTVQDHIIYFAVDTDGDGITLANVGGQAVQIRAEAVAWCAGADGVIAPYSQRGRSDDIYSWDKAKEKK